MRSLITRYVTILIVSAYFLITAGCAVQQPIPSEGISKPLAVEEQGQEPPAEPQKEDPAVLEKIEKGEIVEEDLQTFLTPRERHPEPSPAACCP